MYFIGRGIVKITRGDSNETLTLLQEGSFLSEAYLRHKQPRNVTAISLNYCDLYSLSTSDFEEVYHIIAVLLNIFETLLHNENH